jgi:polysaccharide export outer membrane protein
VTLNISQLIILAVNVAVFAGVDNSAAQYLLGPGDQVSVTLRGAKEIEYKPVRIDETGHIELQYAGKLEAAGLTTGELAKRISGRLSEFVSEPSVIVEITDYGSQPVSVIGAVTRPGVYQLKGQKTLFEVLSLAEGLRNDAGNDILITRRREWGPIPLPGATNDGGGGFSVAQVSVRAFLAGKIPQANIPMRPRDVISVPRGEMVYVVGGVHRPGGFVLGEKESITVLQALSMAEGLLRTASPKNARILRMTEGSAQRAEIPVDIKKILSNKAGDQGLRPNDILFIPDSTAKSAGMRSLDMAIQMATGIAIWRL